jgi:hypothetical protein
VKDIKGNQAKSKEIKRKSKEIKGSPDPQDLREREFGCSGQPWAILAMRRAMRRLSRGGCSKEFKGNLRKSKEIEGN